jgi:transcriptional regulator with XRE-family HTH domain
MHPVCVSVPLVIGCGARPIKREGKEQTDMAEDIDEGWFDPDATTFGDRVAGAREAAGMSQKQLAGRLGIKLETLQSWENDLSEPRANKLQMLAGLVNVSIMWLLEGVGDGVDGPGAAPALNGDIDEVLSELRELKARANRTANRLGALEKRLVAIWQDGAHG